MGWARGFQVGSEAGRAMIDTYRQARQQRELRDIRQARPEESMGYTAEQGRELEAIAGAINPETGQPYYQVEAIPGTAQYRVTPNFQVAGDQGQMQQAMPVEMAPQRVTDYLGQRTAGTLSPEQQERAQYRAMADVLAQANPMEAARLRMSITQDERSAKEFEQSTELRGLQIGSVQRQATINSKIDAVVEEEEKNIAATRDIFTTRGLEGGAAELKKRGLPVRFNNGAIEVLDEKGKVVERITDIDQAISRTEEVIQADMADRLARISGDPAVIRQAVKDRFDRQRQERELRIKESAAPLQADLTRAQISKLNAEADAMGPSAARDQIRLDLAQAEQFRKQLSDIDRELANYTQGSPQHNALTAQRNQVNAALRDINASILSQRKPSALPTGGTSAAPGGVEAARAQALTGKRLDGKPYTAQDKKDYEVTFGEKFPEPTKKPKQETKQRTALPSGQQIFGRLTSQAEVEAAAAAGNPAAIAERNRRILIEAGRGERVPSSYGF